MPFILLVAFVAFTVAAAAAYFSVYGLALIFSGAVIPVIIMASALEVGKLCATSILYNYWHQLSVLMRLYYVAAIFILMLITSGGIYGFLSAAYQQDKIPLEQITQRIELLTAEYERKTQRLQQMDDIISSIGANYISKRLEEKEQQRPEREELVARINAIETEKLELSTKRIETEAHIGPVIYMAEVFGKTPDQATNILILLFIFVFDPLAVALTISVNMLIRNYRDQYGVKNHNVQQDEDDQLIHESSDTIAIDSLIPDQLKSWGVPIISTNVELPIIRMEKASTDSDIQQDPKHVFSMSDVSYSLPNVELRKTQSPTDVVIDDSKVRELINEHNRNLIDTMIKLGAKSQRESSRTVDEIKQALHDVVKDLKDTIVVNNANTPPLDQPQQIVVDQETHDRVDAKLEKRRALVQQIRGNKLS